MKMPFIILDRDGVINYDSHEYIKSADEWEPIPGSLEAIAQLNRLGYRVIIVTNQSGISRGYYDLETLDNIHEKLQRELAAVGGHIEAIFFCPHKPDDNCHCRKPKPGMLEQIHEKYHIDFAETFFIGDSLVDMQVAMSVGCKPILVLSGNGKNTLETNHKLKDVLHFADLSAAVEYIANLTNNTSHYI